MAESKVGAILSNLILDPQPSLLACFQSLNDVCGSSRAWTLSNTTPVADRFFELFTLFRKSKCLSCAGGWLIHLEQSLLLLSLKLEFQVLSAVTRILRDSYEFTKTDYTSLSYIILELLLCWPSHNPIFPSSGLMISSSWISKELLAY